MNTPALHIPSNTIVDIVADKGTSVYVKFPSGKVLWCREDEIDFDHPYAREADETDAFEDPVDYDYDLLDTASYHKDEML